VGDPISYDDSGRPIAVGGTPPIKTKDDRVVCGASCMWWDGIDKAGKTLPFVIHSIPCCPRCGGVLFEFESEAEWFEAVDRYESEGHPGYRAMIEWGRGRCFKTPADLERAYTTRVSP
jgi:hypothetical protein